MSSPTGPGIDRIIPEAATDTVVRPRGNRVSRLRRCNGDLDRGPDKVGGTDRRADGARCGKVHGARIHRRAEDRGWQGDDVPPFEVTVIVENPVIAVSESVSTTPPLMMRVSPSIRR